MITSIMKRDGRVVLYDAGKIASAILKALEAAGEGDAAEAARVANRVERELALECGANTPRIEQIQDLVERQLMECGHDEAAKRYILYRANRTRIREANTSLMKTIDEITNVDARLQRYEARQRQHRRQHRHGQHAADRHRRCQGLQRGLSAHAGAGQGPPGGRYPHPRFRFLFPDHHLHPDRYSAAVPRRVLHRPRLPAGAQEHRQLRGAGGHRHPVQPERPARRPEHPEL